MYCKPSADLCAWNPLAVLHSQTVYFLKVPLPIKDFKKILKSLQRLNQCVKEKGLFTPLLWTSVGFLKCSTKTNNNNKNRKSSHTHIPLDEILWLITLTCCFCDSMWTSARVYETVSLFFFFFLELIVYLQLGDSDANNSNFPSQRKNFYGRQF